MKKIRVLLPLIAFIFVFQACSSDDNAPVEDNNDAVVGTWNLAELNINPPQDINSDGNTTSNILTELPCATGTLIINSDGSWSSTVVNLDITTITGTLFDIRCTNTSSTASGVWQLQNSQLSLFFNTTLFLYNLSGDRLTNTTNEDLPGFMSEVYEKQ
ncbi:hypothetical protein [uncultured Eudoraea sp.]|uniref:hypothetical protein n=1 Tax=uncultured Eudoraea sp. TaxID=1035614 RepID=UPI002612B7B3|nr:hypothetical protein [uncultured Eudoraea sp.]